ncbi:hypothetical protein K456DRAFT_1694150 [Colletotrichum gloeosporioides 23]|nr:hypothetical protein K456DRAFT_1694150 [Colletotrichum gloeosporioides 23]
MRKGWNRTAQRSRGGGCDGTKRRRRQRRRRGEARGPGRSASRAGLAWVGERGGGAKKQPRSEELREMDDESPVDRIGGRGGGRGR